MVTDERTVQSGPLAAPLKWCSVPLSDVFSRNKRLEASVFDVEAKQARELIAKGKYPCVPLYGKGGLIKGAFYPGRFKRIYCEKQAGIGFYLPSQMADIYPKPEKYISPRTNCDLESLRLRPKTLLLTRSGTIGTVSYVSKTIEDCVFSDDVIRISFHKDIDLGYVYIYLKSKIGNQILQTNGYGSVITHLEPEHLAEIFVPNAPVELKAQINRLVEASYALRDESNVLIDQATELLIEELQLPPVQDFQGDNTRVNTFGVNLSQMGLRLDASYHLPAANAIISHLQAYAAEVTTVGDRRISRAVILPGRFARVYVEPGYGRVLFGGKQLHELDPSNKKYLSITKHGSRIVEQLEITENMTLITRSGTVGKVALVPKHWERWVASEHIIRVIPANRNVAGYINIFLASDYGHQLINRYTYGSVVDEIDDHHVRQVPIPLLRNQAAQQRINDLALTANEKRYEAYILEQKALRLMNDEVIFAR